MKPVSKVNGQSEVERADAVAVPYAAAWLGAAGLLPFAAGAIALWVLPATQVALAARVLVGYAAIILAFMGAVYWGLVIAAGARADARRWFTLGVVPALVGWAALLLHPLVALTLLAAAFASVWAIDRAAISAGLAPAWYRRLRDPLTLLVLVSLVAAAAAIWTRSL